MKRVVPTFELYGELLSGQYADPVHYETIRERSSKHDWTIRLHRHERLAQIFLFRTTGVHLRLGDVEHLSVEPLILFVPPGVPHGFRFDENVSGDVLSLPLKELNPETIARIEFLSRDSGVIIAQSKSKHFDDVDTVMRQLHRVFRTVGTEREALLRGLSQLLPMYLVADTNAYPEVGGPAAATRQHLTRHEMQAQDFCSLIEANFSSSVSVSEYAERLGVSAPHLTRICKNILGATPNDLVRQRRMVEAKRLLGYTRLPVSDIAHRSGFRDPAFFSRAFKKQVGRTPQAFREASDT